MDAKETAVFSVVRVECVTSSIPVYLKSLLDPKRFAVKVEILEDSQGPASVHIIVSAMEEADGQVRPR